jgi:hypothetical protein
MERANWTQEFCASPEQQQSLAKFYDSKDQMMHFRLTEMGIPNQVDSLSKNLTGDMEPGAAENLLDSIARLFTLRDVSTLLAEEAKRFLECAIYAVPALFFDTDGFHGIVLYNNAEVRVSLVALPPIAHRVKKNRPAKETPLATTIQANDGLIHCLRASGLRVRMWKANRLTHRDPLTSRVLMEEPTVDLHAGKSLFFEGGIRGMTLLPSEGPLLAIYVASTESRTPVSAHYRDDTKALYSFTAGDMRSSRLQLLATVLQRLHWTEGAKELAALIDHPDHFVRWHLARELLVLDEVLAIPLVRALAESDPHPQVRDIAIQTLHLISEDSSCP